MIENTVLRMITADEALPGRDEVLAIASVHYVNGHSLKGPFAEGMQVAMFGMGCFWGAERSFWKLHGIWSTAVGYAAGITPNPTYEEVCSGQTGHNEVVRVVFDSKLVDYRGLLKIFWESHNPTQGMRQGNDRGTQYRSGIYCFNDDQYKQALSSRDSYQSELTGSDFGDITTEIIRAPEFYFAEDYHQQYLAKNPNGYCGLGGTGVLCNKG
ncbi:MAG: peptide-methionine (S)-S-oxide reductase MsrA [Gammaproteobacteria bacterium]|nr:MAG: peptide-methionine (S)-S-oxide reductase MsrA [Gammaproteobacteria bacterium]